MDAKNPIEIEFAALSVKVAAKTATEAERARWRELRAHLYAPPPPLDRRTHARSARKMRVAYAAEADLVVTFTDDVGSGGVRLRASRPLDTGARLVLRLELGGDQLVTTVGRVAWCKREGGHFLLGVELPELAPEDARRLDAFSQSDKR